MHPECRDASDKKTSSIAQDQLRVRQQAGVRRIKGVAISYSTMVQCGEQIHIPHSVLFVWSIWSVSSVRSISCIWFVWFIWFV